MFLFIFCLQLLGCLSVDPSADVDLERIFRRNDVQKHNSVVDNIKLLLSNLDQHYRRDDINRTHANGVLKDFFFNLGENFIKQNDDYIRNFTDILAKTIEHYYDRHNFTPIFDDDVAIRAYALNNNLNKWHLLPAHVVRTHVKEALETGDTIFHQMIQFYDIFFNELDRKHLNDITRDLTGDNKERKDLIKAIEEAVNYIIIKKFNSLDKDTQNLLQSEIKKLLNGVNEPHDIHERKLNSDAKINVEKEKASEKPTTDKKDYNINKKATNEDEKEVNEALKEITEELERIKKIHLNEKKTELKSEEKIKKEGELLLKQVEKEIGKIGV